MCHAASWLIDGERKPPHGPGFWKWASICSANIPGMLVSTCHSYKIHKPYQYQCIDCKHVYGRHSKRSNFVENKCCGICKGKLEFSGKYNSDGTVSRKISFRSNFFFAPRSIKAMLFSLIFCMYRLGIFLHIHHLTTIHFIFAAQEAEKRNCPGLKNLFWQYWTNLFCPF